MAEDFLLINGSIRKKGTSFSFARTIQGILEEKGRSVEIIHVMDYFTGVKSFDALKSVIAKYGTVGIIAPMYVDFMPYPDVWLLENLSAEFKEGLKGKGFFAICQYGFPDIPLGAPLLETCRIFSESMSMKWLGGLAYGGGAIIDGRNLEEIGKMGQKIIAGFRLACDKIASGESITEQAQKAIAVRIPKILYPPMAAYINRMSRKKAKKMGTLKDFYAKPYLED